MNIARAAVKSSNSELDRGADYDAEELEFLKAMDAYKVANHRPFPTWREVLGVLKGLGYRRPPESQEREGGDLVP